MASTRLFRWLTHDSVRRGSIVTKYLRLNSSGKAFQSDPCRLQDSLIGICEGRLPQRPFIRVAKPLQHFYGTRRNLGGQVIAGQLIGANPRLVLLHMIESGRRWNSELAQIHNRSKERKSS
jgi:hypothetical protein